MFLIAAALNGISWNPEVDIAVNFVLEKNDGVSWNSEVDIALEFLLKNNGALKLGCDQVSSR